MVRLCGLSEQRRAPSSLVSNSPALPRNLTLMPPAGATTISPPPALAPEGAGLQWGNLCPLDLAPSLRSCLSGSIVPAPSPHQAHLLGSCPGGHRDVIPRGMGLNGALFPPDPEQNQGGTGQRLGMSQVPHRAALSSSSSPSLPALLGGSLPLTPTQTTDPPLAPSLGSSMAWGDAAVVGVGFRMALGSFAGARCPLKMTALFGAGSRFG